MKFFGKKTPGRMGGGRWGKALDVVQSVHGSDNDNKTNQKSENAPVVSEKTKQSAGFLKRSVNKIGDVLHKKFGSTEKITDTDSMSNTEYLGEIYKIMVQNRDDAKFEHQQQVSRREEEDSEDQRRHDEVIKALTIRRRPKPKRVTRREKKEEDKRKAEEKSVDKDKTQTDKDKSKADKDKAAQEKAAKDKAEQEKAAKDKAEKDKAAQEKAAKDKADRERVEKDKAEKDRIQKEKDTAKKQKEEAERKEKEAKTEAEKRAAQKEKEEAQKKLDDAKAAEETRRKAAEEAKKKAAEEAKKKAAEEESKRILETADKAQNRSSRRLKGEKEAQEKLKKETAEKLKKEQQEKLKKEAEEKARLEKLKEQKPETATQQPPAQAPKPSGGTATQVITGIATAATGLVPILAKAESPDYNLLVFPKKDKKGITPPKPLTKMTIDEVIKFQSQMSKSGQYPSNAVGKYQIIQSTLKGGVADLKIPLTQLFDEKTQDRLYYEYLTGTKRKKLGNYLTGEVADKPETLAAAQLEMAKEFASFGVPYRVWRDENKNEDGKVIWDARWIEPGQSYYVGSGGNKASVTPEASAKALREERALRLKNKNISPESLSSSSGTQINDSSIQNKHIKGDLNKSSNKDSNSSGGFFANLFGGGSNSAPKVDDRPAYQRK
jgi:chemotaxis protein histidine kinase CheA